MSAFDASQSQESRRTYRHSVIPKRHIALAPLEPNMNLRTRAHNLVQEADDMIALRFGYADNFGHEAGVEEYALPSRDRVRADERVLSCDWLAAYCAAQVSRALSL